MKALKLAGIFVVVLAIVVGVFLLMPSSTPAPLPPPSQNQYEAYRQQFTSDWAQAADWDENIFRSNYDIVQQLSIKYAGDKIDALRQLNTRCGIEVVKNKMLAEWESASCRKSVIDKYVGAINVMTKLDEAAAKDADVKQLRDINGTYQQAYSLAHKNFGLSPQFDGQSWQSYNSYAQGIKNQKANILGSNNYKTYLKNITDIKTGLAAIDGKLQKGRSSYYQALANSIIAYYRKIERSQRTMSQLSDLRSTRNRYESEYSQNSSLTAFTREFAQDVNNNGQ